MNQTIREQLDQTLAASLIINIDKEFSPAEPMTRDYPGAAGSLRLYATASIPVVLVEVIVPDFDPEELCKELSADPRLNEYPELQDEVDRLFDKYPENREFDLETKITAEVKDGSINILIERETSHSLDRRGRQASYY